LHLTNIYKIYIREFPENGTIANSGWHLGGRLNII